MANTIRKDSVAYSREITAIFGPLVARQFEKLKQLLSPVVKRIAELKDNENQSDRTTRFQKPQDNLLQTSQTTEETQANNPMADFYRLIKNVSAKLNQILASFLSELSGMIKQFKNDLKNQVKGLSSNEAEELGNLAEAAVTALATEEIAVLQEIADATAEGRELDLQDLTGDLSNLQDADIAAAKAAMEARRNTPPVRTEERNVVREIAAIRAARELQALQSFSRTYNDSTMDRLVEELFASADRGLSERLNPTADEIYASFINPTQASNTSFVFNNDSTFFATIAALKRAGVPVVQNDTDFKPQ